MKDYFKKNIFPIFIGIFLSFTFIFLEVFPNPLTKKILRRIDNIIYDLHLQTSLVEGQKSSHIAIIDIDEKSLKEIGRWPWPREVISRLAEKVSDLGVTVLAFDVVFAEAENNPVDKIIDYAKKDLASGHFLRKVSFRKELEHLRSELDGDQILADTISKYSHISLGFILNKDKKVQVGALPPSMLKGDSGEVISANGYISNIDILTKSSRSNGFVTVFRDTDGILRRAPLLLEYEKNIYPSLALEVVRKHLLIDKVGVEWGQVGNAKVVNSISLDQGQIPTDRYGHVLIPFIARPGYFERISASDLLMDRVDKRK